MDSKDKASQEDIYRAMRKDIEQGSYPASSRLPSVRTLAKRFSASPNTISKVVSRLMESGLCTARRGVGLFVRGLPNRKLTVIYGHPEGPGEDGLENHLECQLAERLKHSGIEIEKMYVTADDAPYGPSVEKIRKPGRLIITLACTHEPYLKQVSDLRRPLLIIGHAPNRSSASSIVINSFKAGYLAARHLLKKGCRTIIYVGRVRRIRQVKVTESESLKELAGAQFACIEDGLSPNSIVAFSDMEEAAAKGAAIGRPADGLISGNDQGVATVQAIKAIGGKVERVIIGDDRILEQTRHPAAVVFRREELVGTVLAEVNRMVEEQRTPDRCITIDCDLHPPREG